MNPIDMLIEQILDRTLLKSASFRKWMVWRFVTNKVANSYVVVPSDSGLYWRNGIFYAFDTLLPHTLTSTEEYDTSKFSIDDNILDAGANLGGFALPMAKRIKDQGGKGHVFCFEPLYADKLMKNIELNNLQYYITVFEYAIGFYGVIRLTYGCPWNLTSKEVISLSLEAARKMCKCNITAIKCDIELSEYYIKPDELKDIRIFEGEIHKDKEHRPKTFYKMLIDAGFSFYTNGSIIHAMKMTKQQVLPPISCCILLILFYLSM